MFKNLYKLGSQRSGGVSWLVFVGIFLTAFLTDIYLSTHGIATLYLTQTANMPAEMPIVIDGNRQIGYQFFLFLIREVSKFTDTNFFTNIAVTQRVLFTLSLCYLFHVLGWRSLVLIIPLCMPRYMSLFNFAYPISLSAPLAIFLFCFIVQLMRSLEHRHNTALWMGIIICVSALEFIKIKELTLMLPIAILVVMTLQKGNTRKAATLIIIFSASHLSLIGGLVYKNYTDYGVLLPTYNTERVRLHHAYKAVFYLGDREKSEYSGSIWKKILSTEQQYSAQETAPHFKSYESSMFAHYGTNRTREVVLSSIGAFVSGRHNELWWHQTRNLRDNNKSFIPLRNRQPDPVKQKLMDNETYLEIHNFGKPQEIINGLLDSRIKYSGLWMKNATIVLTLAMLLYAAWLFWRQRLNCHVLMPACIFMHLVVSVVLGMNYMDQSRYVFSSWFFMMAGIIVSSSPASPLTSRNVLDATTSLCVRAVAELIPGRKKNGTR